MRFLILVLCASVVTSSGYTKQVDLWSIPEFSGTMFELTESMYLHGYIDVEVATDFTIDEDLDNCLLKNSEASVNDFKNNYVAYLSEVAIKDIKKILKNKMFYVCWRFSFIYESSYEVSKSFHSFVSEDYNIRFQVRASYSN